VISVPRLIVNSIFELEHRKLTYNFGHFISKDRSQVRYNLMIFITLRPLSSQCPYMFQVIVWRQTNAMLNLKARSAIVQGLDSLENFVK
jgi:hypothetical protein